MGISDWSSDVCSSDLTVSVELAAGNEHSFRASGTTIVVPGFLAVYEEGKDTKAKEDEDEGRKLPLMKPGERVPLDRIHADQHFTQPPPRFTEASLVDRKSTRLNSSH